MTRSGVVFCLNLLPHYRSGVFKELISQSGGPVEIAGGTDGGAVQGILGLHDTDVQAKYLRNRHLGPFLWQSGVFRLLIGQRHAAAVVFTGDWKIVSTWPAMLLARVLGLRVVLWTIGWHRADRLMIRRIVRAGFYRLADGLMVYGHRAKSLGVRQGYQSSRIKVVGNSYPFTRPTTVGVVNVKEREVIYVGRLTRAKRIDLLLDAVALIPSTRRPRVVVLGDGPELGNLREMARDMGLDIQFLGAVHDESELGSHYFTARLTVIPGAAGLTVIQSLAFGVPVLTHGDLDRQMPEVEAIVPGTTGEFVDGTVAGFAAAIDRWLQLEDDECRRRADACQSVYDNYWTPRLHASRILEATNAIARDR